MKLRESEEALEYFEFKKKINNINFIEEVRFEIQKFFNVKPEERAKWEKQNPEAFNKSNKYILFFRMYIYDELQEFLLNKNNFNKIVKILNTNSETELRSRSYDDRCKKNNYRKLCHVTEFYFLQLLNEAIKSKFIFNSCIKDGNIELSQLVKNCFSSDEQDFIWLVFEASLCGYQLLFLDSSYFVYNWRLNNYLQNNLEILETHGVAIFKKEINDDTEDYVSVNGSFQKDTNNKNLITIKDKKDLFGNVNENLFWLSMPKNIENRCGISFREGLSGDDRKFLQDKAIRVSDNFGDGKKFHTFYWDEEIRPALETYKDFKVESGSIYIQTLEIPHQFVNRMHEGLDEEDRSLPKIWLSKFYSLEQNKKLEKIIRWVAPLIIRIF